MPVTGPLALSTLAISEENHCWGVGGSKEIRISIRKARISTTDPSFSATWLTPKGADPKTIHGPPTMVARKTSMESLHIFVNIILYRENPLATVTRFTPSGAR